VLCVTTLIWRSDAGVFGGLRVAWSLRACLTGLAKRASSVDGSFEIACSPGGPTLITVDLPCGR
jgi:hypothetical protein